MKKDWKTKKLFELGKTKDAIVSGPFGSNLKVSDYKDEGIPILRLQNIGKGYFIDKNIKYISVNKAEELKYHSFVSGDIVLAKLGIPIGKTCIIPSHFKSGIITADVVRIRPDPKIVDYSFLEYYLNTDLSVKQLVGNIAGATRPRVNLSDVRNIELPLPPLSQQKQIVNILDEMFGKIDELKKITEQQIIDTKQLFESRLNEVFSNSMWCKKTFEEVCVLQRGFDLPTRLRSKGQHPLLSSNGVTDYIDQYKVKGPGVTTGRSGSIGFIHYIEDDFWPLNTALYIKDFKGNEKKFIYYFLKSFNISRFSSGAGVPTLNRNHVHSELVKITDDTKEQRKIVQEMDKLVENTMELDMVLQNKLVGFEELKKSYLQDVFAGKL
jgi:type I restriction enzyme S subunit